MARLLETMCETEISDSHGSEYKGDSLLGYWSVQSRRN
jgi:hypothetical protein